MTPGFILWETRDKERPEQALTVALDLKLTPACLNCLLHVAAVAVENLVEAQTVSGLTKCREQTAGAGAGW